MSYDLEIWAAGPGSLKDALTESDGWSFTDDGAVIVGRSWQIVITGPLRVDGEDVPDDVFRALPGISHVLQLSLEPMGAPKSAYALLKRTAKVLATECHGVVSDQQTDELKLPSGVVRYRNPPPGEPLSLLTLTWFFTDSPLSQPEGVRGVVKLLERELPEALPRRFGEYEPPQFRLQEEGLERFIGFLETHLADIVVWYPSRPVADVNISADDNWGWKERLGFRANYMRLGIEEPVMEQPGWPDQINRVWRLLSKEIHPFYGDVRTLSGYERSRNGALWVGPETESHPIKGWWWRGIPEKLGHATVLGPPYQALWPEFGDRAESVDGLTLVSKPYWAGSDDVSELLGGVPDRIRAVTGSTGQQIEDEYPPEWPFSNRPAS